MCDMCQNQGKLNQTNVKLYPFLYMCIFIYTVPHIHPYIDIQVRGLIMKRLLNTPRNVGSPRPPPPPSPLHSSLLLPNIFISRTFSAFERLKCIVPYTCFLFSYAPSHIFSRCAALRHANAKPSHTAPRWSCHSQRRAPCHPRQSRMPNNVYSYSYIQYKYNIYSYTYIRLKM